MAKNFAGTVSILLFSFLGESMIAANDTKPHIIIIVADDLGWNDVGFHGSNQIPTPNIDALAYNGVILNNHYTGAVCTPSRAALLTGKSPINLGMQHLALGATEPRGLPLTEKLLPQYLKEGGYTTHIVGKWHLGFYKKEYTPTFRGFDSHFGYWSGHQDYYNHEFESSDNYRGYDMRRNMSVSYETKNRYSTDLYTEETVRLIDTHDKTTPMFIYLAHAAVHSGNSENLLQAPDEEVVKFFYISDPERRKYAAMVSKLDQSVGEVVAALRRREMLPNSIILFVADNGAPTFGPHHNAGSNYPLRGMKTTAWEGAVHCVAAIWSPLINQAQRVSDQLFHMSDWLPTLLSAAGINTTLPTLDGFDMWPTIVDNEEAPRTEVLINIDEISNYSAIRSGNFKYLVGYPGRVTGWYGNLSASNDIDLNYQPENVLRSKAGAAMIGLTTERQLSNSSNNVKVLTPSKINRLRSEATLYCNVAENQMIACDPTVAPCLFNLEEDPCEMINIIDMHPEIVQMLEESLEKHKSTALPAANIPGDIEGDPVKWKSLWVNWQDPKPAMTPFITPKTETNSASSSTTIIAILGCILICAVAIIIILMIKNRRKSLNSRNNHIDISNVDELKGSHL
ncbi:arylsulfatase B isoform X2 [Diachasma alloeum]|nr:arylsulfatase B isoform X2 [Diachasma alloeum]